LSLETGKVVQVRKLKEMQVHKKDLSSSAGIRNNNRSSSRSNNNNNSRTTTATTTTTTTRTMTMTRTIAGTKGGKREENASGQGRRNGSLKRQLGSAALDGTELKISGRIQCTYLEQIALA
jgi:hypothetical protein